MEAALKLLAEFVSHRAAEEPLALRKGPYAMHPFSQKASWCLLVLLLETTTIPCIAADGFKEPWLTARMLEMSVAFSIEPTSDEADSQIPARGEHHSRASISLLPYFTILTSSWLAMDK